MNALITQSLEQGSINKLQQFPDHLISDEEKKVIAWISKYTMKYGETPSLTRFQKEFDFFVPVRVSDPIDDLYDQELNRRVKNYFMMETDAVGARIREGEDVDVRIEVQRIMRSLQLSDGALARYSTYERERYFRTGHYPTGIALVDRTTGGLCSGDFFLVAGRLGTGKSLLATWFSVRWWQAGLNVLFVSKEMLASDIFSRADGMLGAFDPLKIRTEESDVSPKLSVLSHISKTAGGEIYVPSRSVSTMEEVAELIRITDVDLCVIDGVYLMKSSAGFSSRWERVADVSNQIKAVALDTETPIVGVTQLKRTGMKEEYDPEDIAYSDALGQDADFVMTIRSVDKSKGRIEVQLIKNRFGPEIGAMLRFDYKTMSLIDESIEGMTDW